MNPDGFLYLMVCMILMILVISADVILSHVAFVNSEINTLISGSKWNKE